VARAGACIHCVRHGVCAGRPACAGDCDAHVFVAFITPLDCPAPAASSRDTPAERRPQRSRCQFRALAAAVALAGIKPTARFFEHRAQTCTHEEKILGCCVKCRGAEDGRRGRFSRRGECQREPSVQGQTGCCLTAALWSTSALLCEFQRRAARAMRVFVHENARSRPRRAARTEKTAVTEAHDSHDSSGDGTNSGASSSSPR
jgi:hypothetical protein